MKKKKEQKQDSAYCVVYQSDSSPRDVVCGIGSDFEEFYSWCEFFYLIIYFFNFDFLKEGLLWRKWGRNEVFFFLFDFSNEILPIYRMPSLFNHSPRPAPITPLRYSGVPPLGVYDFFTSQCPASVCLSLRIPTWFWCHRMNRCL